MKRLIKKMPYRQGLENYILAYANEKDGSWADGDTWKDSDGNEWMTQECVTGGSACVVPDWQNVPA